MLRVYASSKAGFAPTAAARSTTSTAKATPRAAIVVVKLVVRQAHNPTRTVLRLSTTWILFPLTHISSNTFTSTRSEAHRGLEDAANNRLHVGQGGDGVGFDVAFVDAALDVEEAAHAAPALAPATVV